MGLLSVMNDEGKEAFVESEQISRWEIVPISKHYQIILDADGFHYYLRKRYTTYDVAKSQLQRLYYQMATGLKVCDKANEDVVCSELTDYDKQRKTKN